MSTLSHIATRHSVSQMMTIILLSVYALAGLTGCETSEKAKKSDAEKQVPSQTIDTSAIVDDAEAARDRNLEFELSFEHVDSTDELEAREAIPDAARVDRSFLLEHLFDTTASKVKPQPLSGNLASYDADDRTIRYRHGDSEEQTHRAIFAAVVEAIDTSQFEALPESETWDQYLAHQTARTTTSAFALASHAVSSNDTVTHATLAQRPELVTRVDGLQLLVDSTGQATDNSIVARETQFVRQEAWTLAAALYRANKWSGVELAWLMPPSRTSDVVRPGDWLNGAAIATWQWPDADATPDREGQVGAAVTSLWLAETVSSSALRTLFSGWTSDRYRYWEARDDAPERFEWLTLWDSPGSADQVTKAFELTLRERFPDAPDAHFVVFQKGLKVGVILSDEPAEQRRARARDILDAKVQFEPRDGLPVSFVPTRSDLVAAKSTNATLKDSTWADPASGLRMNLSAVEDWKIDRPDASAVRWFARGPDSALIQLTMEMHDPFGPEFGSDAYRDALRNAFTRSMEDTEISGISNVELPMGRTLKATVTGSLEGNPTRIRFWHFKIDDLIFTYSYQAPSDKFESYADRAAAIISSAERHAESPTSDADSDGGDAEDKGIIEFEVEN